MADDSNWYNFVKEQINEVLESETPSQSSHPTGGPSTLPPPLLSLLPHSPYLPHLTSMPLSHSTWPPLTDILFLFSCLSRPSCPGTKVAASGDEYNVPLLGSDNSWPLDVPRYAILYYSYSISLLTVHVVPPLPLHPLLLPPPTLLSVTLLHLLLLLLLVSQLQSSGKLTLLMHRV